MTLAEALAAARAALRREPQPDVAARALLAHALATTTASLLARRSDVLAAADHRAFDALVRRVADGEPLAYVVGHQPFLDFSLRVTPAVLIPRVETEGLAEWAIRYAQRRAAAGAPIRRGLDVGTGSGALAIALARACPEAAVTATDNSDGALAVAADNARRLACADRIVFLSADLWPPDPGEPFDLVVANLPYVGTDELDDVGRSVLGHEPHGALFSGRDGLDLLRRFVPELPIRLSPDGAAALEIGWRQGETVVPLARAAFPNAVVTLRHDVFDRPRLVTIEPPT